MHQPPASDLPRELDVINEITKAVTSTLDVAEIIRATLARSSMRHGRRRV